MCLSPLGFPVDKIGAMKLVLPIRDLLDHRPRRFAVGRGCVGLQIGLGGVEPIEPIFDLLFQNVGVPVSQSLDLRRVEVPLDRLAVAQALIGIFEG